MAKDMSDQLDDIRKALKALLDATQKAAKELSALKKDVGEIKREVHYVHTKALKMK